MRFKSIQYVSPGSPVRADHMNDIADAINSSTPMSNKQNIEGVVFGTELNLKMPPFLAKLTNSGVDSGDIRLYNFDPYWENDDGCTLEHRNTIDWQGTSGYVAREINGTLLFSGAIVILHPFLKENGQVEFYFDGEREFCEVNYVSGEREEFDIYEHSGVSGVLEGTKYLNITYDLDQVSTGDSGFIVVTGHMYQDDSGAWNPIMAFDDIFSGVSGETGPTGESGTSGYSGYSGASGASGASGYSGYSGASGASGTDIELPSGASGDILRHNGTDWVTFSPPGTGYGVLGYSGGTTLWVEGTACPDD